MRILLPDAFGILLSIFISISPLKSCFWQKAAVTNVFTKFIVIWKGGDRLSILVRSSVTKNRSSLCTDVPPPSEKIGRRVSSPDFFWGRRDVCTQAIDLEIAGPKLDKISWTQFFEKGYREIASTKGVILGNMVYGRSHQCWKQTEAK